MMRVNAGLGGMMIAAVALTACAPTVMAPTVPVMPGPNKPFNQFSADQQTCQAYANSQTAPLAAQVNNQAFGTALCAGLGAAVGGGRGAAIGAASGAVVGGSMAAQGSALAGMSIQQQYDIYYSQCMYARGNQIPSFSPNMYAIPPYPGAPPPPPRY